MTLTKVPSFGPIAGKWRKVLFNPVQVERRLVGVRFVFWPEGLPIAFDVSKPSRLKQLSDICGTANQVSMIARAKNVWLIQLGIWMQKEGAGVKALNQAAIRVDSPTIDKQFFSQAQRARKKLAVGLIPCEVQAVVHACPVPGSGVKGSGKPAVLYRCPVDADGGVRQACAVVAAELQRIAAEGFEFDPDGRLYQVAAQLQESAVALAEAATLLSPEGEERTLMF